ncbi:MAG: hypothetical protein U1F53_01605 [Burkholderiaceae bacterium]
MSLVPRAAAARCMALTACLVTMAAGAAPLSVRILTYEPPAEVDESVSMWATDWANGSVKMPFVESRETPAVAERINAALFLGVMETPAPARPAAAFHLPKGQWPQGTASQDVEVVRNDARVLSIVLTAEGCGAYCETYSQHHNFDVRSGRALALDDLLTPTGLSALTAEVARARQSAYTRQLKTLQQERAAAQRRGHRDELDDLDDRIALNKDCLEGERHSPRQPDDVRQASFSLPVAGGMALSTARCSNHASRALDDVGEVTVTVPAGQLRPWLSPYGHAVVLGDGDAPPPATLFGQVLRGRIGTAPVTLLLERPQANGSVVGRYCYDKYRQPIRLSGRREGTQLRLDEGEGEPSATLRLAWGAHGLAGQWVGGGKTLPVQLDW